MQIFFDLQECMDSHLHCGFLDQTLQKVTSLGLLGNFLKRTSFNSNTLRRDLQIVNTKFSYSSG